MKFQSTTSFLFSLIFAQLLEPSIQPCKNLKHDIIDCPSRSESVDKHIEKYIKECDELNKGKLDETIGCRFFPDIKNGNDKPVPCNQFANQQGYNTTNCTHGYIVRATRQKRGSVGFVYITVQFFGLIQPVPNLMTIEEALRFLNDKPSNKGYKNCFDNNTDSILPDPIGDAGTFDVTEWISLGISPTDDKMGSDLILYCHPFMDREAWNCGHNFTKIDKKFYPDDIGIGLTVGKGVMQAYDAEKKFGEKRGRIQDVKVTYVPSATNTSYGFLKCSAEISTFILLQSRAELTKGIQIDMEKQSSANIFIATGGCLVRDCLGDVKENELRDVARRTTVMSIHREVYISDGQEVLYDLGEKSGSGQIVGMSYITMLFLFSKLGWIFL